MGGSGSKNHRSASCAEALCPILEILGQWKGESMADGEGETLHWTSSIITRQKPFISVLLFSEASLLFSLFFYHFPPGEQQQSRASLLLSAFYSPPCFLPGNLTRGRTTKRPACFLTDKWSTWRKHSLRSDLVARKYTELEELALISSERFMSVCVMTRHIKLAFHKGLVHDELIVARLLKDQRSVIASSFGYLATVLTNWHNGHAKTHSIQRKHGISTIFLESETEQADLCITSKILLFKITLKSSWIFVGDHKKLRVGWAINTENIPYFFES